MTREDLFGICMSAYYGGRAECRIRRVPTPVVYVDFLSMYPTVNTLMGLWQVLTAEQAQIVDATEEVRRLLARVTPERCFDPRLWPKLRFFAQILPDGDVLPVRAPYDPDTSGLNIGVNPLRSEHPLWCAGPDLVGSVLLTDRVPKILRAIRLRPMGRQKGLKPVRLRGLIPIDPRKQDFFKVDIEARKGLDQDATLAPEERERLNAFLKVLANSGSYGIYAEMNRQELPGRQQADVTVFGAGDPFTCKTKAPEMPGPFCFPPIAALIPAAARLMLALLERCVRDADGAHAFCDTDSMAIVATETGGFVPCPGGWDRGDRVPFVRALSWAEVDTIVEQFAGLNPYDRQVVAGSILKIEKENYPNE